MKFSQNLSKKIFNIPFIWIVNICIFIYFLVWINSVFNGFVWDDEEQIVNNTIIQHLFNFPQIFSGATFGTGGAGLSGWFFRPFLTLSYMLSFAIFGQNAWGYHLIQVIFHLINSILIFKILQIIANEKNDTKTRFLNFLISFLFAIHPVTVEAVSYIAASSEVMYTFFNLSAFYLIAKSNSKNDIFYYIKIYLLIFSGLLFKESSIVFLPIIIVYIFLYKKSEWKKWTAIIAPIAVFYFLIRLFIVNTPIRHPEFAPISEASLITRIQTIPKELFSYIHIIFYPDKLAISQHFLVKSFSNMEFWLYVIIEIILLLFILFLSWKTKSKIIFFGLLWFSLGFGLISNIFPLDMTIAERWIYFPFVGFIFMTTAIFFELSKIMKNKFIFILIFIFALFFPLGIRTIIRNSNWQNGLTLYSHDEKISHNSFDLENNLGVELFRNGDFKNAKVHFEKSIQLQPKWYFTYNNLGAVYQNEGDIKKAIILYEKTLSISDYYLSYENLSNIYFETKSSDETLKFVLKALSKLPNNSQLNKIAALTYYKTNATESAKIYAQRAYALNPTSENYLLLQQILNQK